MRYQVFDESIAEVDKIVVDGNECGVGLQLSHWPGNQTPGPLRADLSVEILLRLAADPNRDLLLADRELVTNDHYDTDGLLSAWAALHPDEALKHSVALVATAEAGDFYEFSTPDAVKLDLAIQAFRDPRRSPLASRFDGLSKREIEQLASDAILAELPGLLYDCEKYRELWTDGYAEITRRLGMLNDGRVQVQEYPETRLSVLRTDEPLDHFSRNTFASGHRLLEIRPGNRGTYYVLHYRQLLWYDLVSRPSTPRHVLTQIAGRLNELEPTANPGAWVTTDWPMPLLFAAKGNHVTTEVGFREEHGMSRLAPEVVVALVEEELTRLDNAGPK